MIESRHYTLPAQIWAALDAGRVTLPVALALADVASGESIYRAAKTHRQHLRTVQRAQARLEQATRP